MKLQSDVECKSADVYLGKFSSIYGCAAACEERDTCTFFVFGKGSKRGKCYWEKTIGPNCPEGWENDEFDFMKITGILSERESLLLSIISFIHITSFLYKYKDKYKYK